MAARLRPFFSPEIFFFHRLANASEDASRAALLLAMSGKTNAAAAIQRDAAAKASGKLVPDILAYKLWPRARPRWISQLWKELKQDLLAAQEDWDVWTDWYEARLQGKAYYEDRETAILRIAACLVLSMAYKAVFIGVYVGVTPLHPFGRVGLLAARAPIPAIAA